MSEKVTVLYFSSIAHGFLYQRPQQLFREWRANFTDSYEFYYVEPPLVVKRFVARRLHYFKQSLETLLLKKHNNNAEDVFVLTWPSVPIPFRGLRPPKRISQRDLCFRLIDSAVRRTLRQRCGRTQTKVAIVASPIWGPLVSSYDFDLICYDYMDPVEVSSLSDRYPVHDEHKKLLGKSDIIFVTAENLREDALSIADEKDVLTVSNGTDAEFFEKNKNSYEITDYTKTDKKRVGYVGAYHMVDMDLIYAAAQELTEVDFLLVGPLDRQNQRRSHQKPENVFILGTKTYKQLPAYVQIFDVALIPFKRSVIVDAIDPVKLYEYFSLGKPVVATGLRELKKFDDGQLLRVAETQDEFVNGINAFLKYDAKAWQASRRQIARQNSWLSKATIMIRSIESRIADHPCT
jgi:glycosyltransferase involved in cell wall biosynthesis